MKNVTEFMIAAISFSLGGFFGVTMMCLVQINKDKHYFIGKEDKENEK